MDEMLKILVAITTDTVVNKILKRVVPLAIEDAEGNYERICEIVREEYDRSPLPMFRMCNDTLVTKVADRVVAFSKSPEAPVFMAKLEKTE